MWGFAQTGLAALLLPRGVPAGGAHCVAEQPPAQPAAHAGGDHPGGHLHHVHDAHLRPLLRLALAGRHLHHVHDAHLCPLLRMALAGRQGSSLEYLILF
eukprot:1194763-Prorocentrum_minimum.AAC.11